MKNTMISDREREALEKVHNAVEELIKAHEEVPDLFEKVMKSTDIERIHIFLYLEALKDLTRNVGAIHTLLKISEEDFLKEITNEGKTSLKEVERKVMSSMVIQMLMN